MATDPRRTTATITFLLVTIASVYFLQSVFIKSDHSKATAMARSFTAGGDSIESAIAKRHPGVPIEWRSEITSHVYGFVRVTAVAAAASGPPVEYIFEVDIPRLQVKPKNAAAEDVMAAVLQSARPAPPVPATAPAATPTPSPTPAPTP